MGAESAERLTFVAISRPVVGVVLLKDPPVARSATDRAGNAELPASDEILKAAGACLAGEFTTTGPDRPVVVTPIG